MHTKLNGSSTFEVLFDLGCVLSVEAFQLLVELHVAIVDVVNVRILVEVPTPAVLCPLLNPTSTWFYVK